MPPSNHSSLSPFRVLGIALVIDQLGKEPCMAFRYPTSVDSGTANSGSSDGSVPATTGSPPYNAAGATSAGSHGASSRRSEELFFTLSSRQMAKLFRPKHSLCGQPMTLSVGGTVFCFRAVLMGADPMPPESKGTANTNQPESSSSLTSSNTSIHSTTPADNNNKAPDSDPLVLFSVVIALAPQVDHISSIPISGWFEATPGAHNSYNVNLYSEQQQQQQQQQPLDTASNSSRHKPKDPTNVEVDMNSNKSTTSTNVTTTAAEVESQRAASASFLAVRRVQVSLARLCRVLRREERRCRYISWQSQSFFQIRAALTQKWDESSSTTNNNNNTNNNNKPPTVVDSTTTTIINTNNTSTTASRGATSTRPPVGGDSGTTGNADFFGKTPPASGSGLLSGSNNDIVTQRHKPQHRRGNSMIAGTGGSGAGGGNTSLNNTLSSGSDGGLGGLLPTSSVNTNTKNLLVDGTGATNAMDAQQQHKMQLEDREQEVLEHVLASGGLRVASCHDSNSSNRRIASLHHGNLGRELVQVFHALSRNDHYFPPSSSVLSGRDGVVYVNRHIAVALEAASLPKAMPSLQGINTVTLRPYHTLIFPNASPSELLQALQSSGFTAPLQQLLLMVRPSKPLTDIAVDANLPLSVTMELANYMVAHRACVAATVLTRASRLACKHVDRIQALALDFSQTFDDWSVSLFLIVSFLTMNGRTLGESMAALTTSGDDAVGAALRASILGSMFNEEDTESYIFVSESEDSDYDDATGVSGEKTQQRHLHPRAEELEEVLYSMAIWLLSHQVLGQIQDYLVISVNPLHSATNTGTTGNNPPNNLHGEKQNIADDYNTRGHGIGAVDPTNMFDETLLKELQESDCLLGTTSIVAISWHLGLDKDKLYSWALRQDTIRIISRLPAPGDDWGAV